MEISELSTSDLVDFKIKLQGQILKPGEDDYDDIRAVWNGMINRTPALIEQCKNVTDVIESVHFARKKNLVISVKGGGHGVAGKAVCNDGLMIDFSQMTSVTVDQANKTVRVEPGVTLGDLDRETAKFGLLTTGGIVSTTGVAGLTLGGGIGYLARKYGLAADNLLSLEIVTADGTLLNCSPTEHQDLFWALRGGGGNFGIVVSFQFQLHTENTDILVAQIFYPMKDAHEVLLKYRDLMRTAPDELAGYGLVVNIPPVEPFAEELQGTPAFFLLATYAGDHEKGRQLLNPFTEIGEPILAGISAMK
jgi:FAD/FMN-containing dehydrogenase